MSSEQTDAMRGAWLLLMAMLLAACTSTTESSSFPMEPAPCAGPRLPGVLEEDRRTGWRSIAEMVDDAEDDERVRAWVTFDRIRSTEEASMLAEGMRLNGVLLVWDEVQGTTAKAWDGSHDEFGSAELPDRARATLRRSLDRPREAHLQPADPDVSAGNPPVGGVLAVGTPEELSRFVRENECSVYSVGRPTHPVRGGGSPPLSRRLDDS